MNTTRVTRTLTAASLAALLLGAGASVAQAAPTTGHADPVGHYAGAGVGYDGVIDGRAAGSNLLKLAGKSATLNTYCLQYHVPSTTDPKVAFAPTSWTDSGITNVAKAADVVTRHDKIGTMLPVAEAENTAVQLAVWTFTDKIDYKSVPNAQIVARVTELVTGAKDAVEGASKWNISLETEYVPLAEMGDKAGATTSDMYTGIEATVTDQLGRPVDGAAVTVTVAPDAGSDTATALTAVTNADGVTEEMFVATPKTEVTATVSVEGTVASGSVFVPADGGQKVITVESAEEVALADAKLTLAPAPAAPVEDPAPADPTPVANPVGDTPEAPAPVAAPVEDTKPSVLPHTGPLGTAGLFAGLVALAGGAVVVARKARARRA